MDEPMSDADACPRRDSDEVSIASDFSIIPEGCVGVEDISPQSPPSMASGVEFLKSEDIRPSAMAETSFGKVLFQNIQATYTADSDIAVSYILTTNVTAKSSDRVALYKVGFGSPQDYLCYQWAPTPSRDHTTNQLPITVVFKATSLPKDAGEFFQFCYVTHEGQIVGVSTPFQLHPVGSLNAGNVCGVDDDMEDGMVVVCTNESVLHDKINKLTTQNELLTRDSSSTQQQLEQKVKLLEDKAQQLTMCQHHLQALETKMKKETSEKCELMGRVGQVVEEKGYLEDRVKTIEKSLSTSTTRAEELEGKLLNVSCERNKMEEELLQMRKQKEQLDHNLQETREEYASYKQTTVEELTKVREEATKVKEERNALARDLEFWTSSAASDKNEKNSLALKFSTINEELITKLEELEKNKKLSQELEEKLAITIIELTSVRDKVKALEEETTAVTEERNVHHEREVVISQDNEKLKLTISQLKERIEDLESTVESVHSGREAAERIASDLSSRLQTAKAEYQNLALTNVRLAKKVKKLRQALGTENCSVKMSAMTDSVSSHGSSMLHVTADDCEDLRELEGATARDIEELEVASMLQSCSSALTACSSCSHNTQQLSDEMHRKMEDIVCKLTGQISSLKDQLETRNIELKNHEGSPIRSEPRNEPREEEEVQEIMIAQQEESIPQDLAWEDLPNQQEPVVEEERSQEEQLQQSQNSNRSSVDRQEGSNTENQVLYGNSFLPAQRTAPVFLPERGLQVACITSQEASSTNIRPSAPSPTPSMLSLTGQSLLTTTSSQSLVVPQPISIPAVAQVQASPSLPPPLLPETTPTARQAAVLSQFSSQQLAQGIGHESDDDDFHSTSDNDETPTLAYDSGKLIECPMCNLSFQPDSIRLLEEHINSHLEYVCPVCSIAYQRNNQKAFEEHVHSHFAEDEGADDNPLDDPSGPWGARFRSTRLLEID